MHRKGGTTVLSISFLSHSIKKVPRGGPLCFEIVLVWKKVWFRRGLPRSFVEKFLSQSAEKNRRGTFLYFECFW